MIKREASAPRKFLTSILKLEPYQTTTEGQFIAERDTVTRLQCYKFLPLAFTLYSDNKQVT
jgi:hypothetical protein